MRTFGIALEVKYFIEIAYNGKGFFGWQVQPNVRTVQGELNKCLSLLIGEPIYLVGAGRTDTGVHARQMFAHFEVSKSIDTISLIHRCNSFFEKGIAIKKIFAVNQKAHARFDANSRLYRYYILVEKDPFLHQYSWHIPNFKYDVEQLNDLSNPLLKYTDFESFAKSKSDSKTSICKIMTAQWNKKGSLYTFTIKADRFLRNMVRTVVGTLIYLAKNKKRSSDFSKIIELENRSEAGPSAPAKGLFLEKIEYPKWVYEIGDL